MTKTIGIATAMAVPFLTVVLTCGMLLNEVRSLRKIADNLDRTVTTLALDSTELKALVNLRVSDAERFHDDVETRLRILEHHP